MIWLLLLTALATGVVLPIQNGINAELRNFAGHPLIAAIFNFIAGTLALMAVAAAMRAPLPAMSRMWSAPWWVWTGGMCGAFYIVMTILLAPRLGAATLIGVSVTGQMLASLILDHYGLIGYPVHPVNVWRLAGAVLLLGGLALIQHF